MENIETLLEDLNINWFEIYSHSINWNSLTLRFEELIQENEEETVVELLNRNNIDWFITFLKNWLWSTTLTWSF